MWPKGLLVAGFVYSAIRVIRLDNATVYMENIEALQRELKRKVKRETFALVAAWIGTLALLYRELFAAVSYRGLPVRVGILAVGLVLLWTFYHQEKKANEGYFFLTYACVALILWGLWALHGI